MYSESTVTVRHGMCPSTVSVRWEVGHSQSVVPVLSRMHTRFQYVSVHGKCPLPPADTAADSYCRLTVAHSFLSMSSARDKNKLWHGMRCETVGEPMRLRHLRTGVDVGT